MHDNKPDSFVDELLDASLRHYRGEEPRSGLEMRILAGIRTRERARRRRWVSWAVALSAGTLAIIVLALHFARAPLRQPAPSTSLPQPATTQPAPQPVSKKQQALASLKHAGRDHPVITYRSRPEQFPTPLPLTEQEKLLLVYVAKATKPDVAAETDEKANNDLEVPEITIVALKITPLSDSQSDQEK